MRYTCIILLFTLFACQENGQKDVATLPSMTGGLNELIIVLEEHLWQADVGDSLRRVWEQRYKESLGKSLFLIWFKYHPKHTQEFSKHIEIFFFSKKKKKHLVSFKENTNANGQLMALVTYQNTEELKVLLKQYAYVISHRFQEQEKERLKTQIVLQTGLEKVFQKHEIDLNIPKDFFLVLDTTDFTWIEYSPKDKEIIQGVFIYRNKPRNTFYNMAALSTKRLFDNAVCARRKNR